MLTYIFGLFCAAVLLWITERSLDFQRAVQFWAIGLVIAALIYVVFASVDGNWDWLPTELGSVGIYGLFAVLALRHSAWWLVVGWGGHVSWDVGLHAGGYPGFVPTWYPGACMGFDWAVAAYFIWKMWSLRSR